MIKENQKLLNLLLKLGDLALCALSMVLAYYARFAVFGWLFGSSAWKLELDYYLRLLLVLAPVYLLLYHQFNLYDTFRFKSLISETEKVIGANFIGLSFAFLLSFFLREVNASRLALGFFGIFNILFTSSMRICIRLLLRALRRRGRNLKHLLLVGWNEASGEFYDKISANRNFGYHIIGYLSDKVGKVGERKIKYHGTLSRLEHWLESGRVDEVVISLDYDEFPLLGEIIEACEKAGIKSSLLPFYTKYLPARPYIDEVEGIPLINIRHVPLDNFLNSFLKRGFDIVASALGLLAISPLLGITALCIKLSSPGPVIYKQQRIGRNKKEFTMYKFRSMRTEDNNDMTTWGNRKDDRRTRFGALIRKLSIDELPQLFNVLKGDMSLVGPRPERPFFVEKFREEVPLYMLKHLVRPGITGWAQVNGWRGDTSIVERIKCDIFYIENWSFLFDVKILLMTLVTGIYNSSEDL